MITCYQLLSIPEILWNEAEDKLVMSPRGGLEMRLKVYLELNDERLGVENRFQEL